MSEFEFEKQLSVEETGIGGLRVLDLAVHGDSRGWFKENWQRAKMTALGIPDLKVVQNNISYNDSRGVTRGIHAEPWYKFIAGARGAGFGACGEGYFRLTAFGDAARTREAADRIKAAIQTL